MGAKGLPDNVNRGGGLGLVARLSRKGPRSVALHGFKILIVRRTARSTATASSR